MRISIRPPKPSRTTTGPMFAGAYLHRKMLFQVIFSRRTFVSGRLEDAKRCSTGARGKGLSYLHKGFSQSVSAGIGLQKGVLRSLARKQALAVKDANPRISTRTLHIDLIMLGKPRAGLVTPRQTFVRRGQ